MSVGWGHGEWEPPEAVSATAAPLEKAVSQAEEALQNWRDSPLTGMAHVPQATRDDAALLYNTLTALLAALDADRSAQMLRHAARELQYIVDAGPCNLSDQHISGETFACIKLAEELLGPMRGWPDEPNASGVIARRYFAEKGER